MKEIKNMRNSIWLLLALDYDSGTIPDKYYQWLVIREM